MSMWQPIETAPKDGTPILLFSPGPKGGRWISRFAPQPVWSVVGAATPMSAEFWGSEYFGPKEIAQPTHWMPLPDRPAEPS